MKFWKCIMSSMFTLVACAALGCASSEPPNETSSPEEVGEAAQSLWQPPQWVDQVCSGVRRIGKLGIGANSCPSPGIGSGWSKKKLFGQNAPPPFGRYCLYEWELQGPPDADTLPSYAGALGTVWTDADCAAVVPLSDSTEAVEELGAEYNKAFLTSVERPSSLVLPPPPPLPFFQTEAVRIAILDSWPAEDKVGDLPHGFGMAAIAESLARAPSDGSATRTIPYLTLNVDETDVTIDDENGGTAGYIGNLAVQIRRAVTSWKSEAPAAKLVINLSIGWHDDYHLNPANLPRRATLAVKDALEEAACEGAIVFAAAGNAEAGVSPGSGPMYPAAWENIAAPPVGPFCLKSGGQLLYSVGGVDAADIPIRNARPGSTPRLVAPAFAVPGRKTTKGGSPVTHVVGPFTGTSVAAAAASGAAALVWRYKPFLSRAELYEVLRSSGPNLGVEAEVCPDGSNCASVRRLSVARALKAAGMSLPACGSSSSPLCPKIGAFGGGNVEWSATDQEQIEDLATFYMTQLPLFGMQTEKIALPQCSTSILIPDYMNDYSAASPCSSEKYPNHVLLGALVPQPPIIPCPACGLIVSPGDPATLVLVMDEHWVGNARAQTLMLSNRTSPVMRYDLGNKALAAGEVFRTLIPALPREYDPQNESTQTFQYATIEWYDALNGISAQSELVVTTN